MLFGACPACSGLVCREGYEILATATLFMVSLMRVAR